MKPADDGYRMLAAQCLRKQARRLARQIKRVGQEDQIEVVHQARVAARRLTAAVRAFGPLLGNKKSRRWQDDVGRVLRRLGDARDKDVQIEFIRQALKQTPERPLRPGIRRLLLRLQQQRRDHQPKVQKAARILGRSGALKAVRRQADAMAEALPPGGATIQTPFVFDTAWRRIAKRIDKLLAYEACLSSPGDAGQHHQMRIAAKRLRYTMELFRPAYEGELDGCLSAMKKLQDLLGDLHDCDVWLQLLPDFLAEENKRAEAWFGKASSVSSANRLRAGIEHLQASRLSDRERIFAKLGQYWRQLRAAGTFDAMTALLSEHFARAEALAAEQAAQEAARAAEQAARAAEAQAARAAEAQAARAAEAQAARAAEAQAAPQAEETARQPEEADQAQTAREAQEPAQPQTAPDAQDALTQVLAPDAPESEDLDDEETKVSFASPLADTLDWPLGRYVACEPPPPEPAETPSDPPDAE
jgi:CHAD domain-containing protein